jgi:hypothetical protein
LKCAQYDIGCEEGFGEGDPAVGTGASDGKELVQEGDSGGQKQVMQDLPVI